MTGFVIASRNAAIAEHPFKEAISNGSMDAFSMIKMMPIT